MLYWLYYDVRPWVKFKARKANDTEPYYIIRWAFVWLQRNAEIRQGRTS